MPYSIKKLGEVVDLNFGERITRTNNSGNKYPVYGGGGESFRTDKFNRESEYVISRFAIAENCVRFVEGKFWLMDSGGTFSVKKDSTNKLDKNFVGNVLLMRQKEIYNCARGGAQKNIDVDFVKKIQIPIPPLATQKQIVERLDKIVEARKLNDELIQKTDELFQSLLHKELNPAGKNWEVKKLGSVFDRITDAILPTKHPKLKFNFIGLENIESNTSRLINISFVEGRFIKSAKTRFKIGDVLYGKLRPYLNKVWLADFEGICSTDIWALRAKEEIILPQLLGAILQQSSIVQKSSASMAGANLPRANKDIFDKIAIALPPINTQKQIVAKLSAVQDYKKQLLEQKSKLKELFDSALSKSMKN